MKRKIAAAAAVGVVSFLFAFMTFLHFSQEKKVNIECREFRYPLFRLICEAYKEKNIEKCDYFKYAYKELCAKAVFAAMKVNQSFCNSLREKVYRNVCFTKLAIQTNDYSYCPNDCCKMFFGAKEACENISSGFLKNVCLAKFYRNADYCEKISDDYQKNLCMCLVKKGKNCKNIVFTGETKTESCNDFASTSKVFCVAFLSNSIEECDSGILRNEEDKELCKIYFITKLFYKGAPLCIYTEY